MKIEKIDAGTLKEGNQSDTSIRIRKIEVKPKKKTRRRTVGIVIKITPSETIKRVTITLIVQQRRKNSLTNLYQRQL